MSVNRYNATTDSMECIAGGTLFADSPIGTILAFGGTAAPSGWFLCQGQALSRTDYAELFAVIGTSFGSGDGSTTFNLPDMRESVPKGAGLTGKTVGAHLDADGLAVGEFLDDRVQTHNHSAPNGANFFITGNVATMAAGGGVQYNGSNVTTNNSGRSGATTEVKSVGVNYIIKAKMVSMPADLEAQLEETCPFKFGVDASGNYGYYKDGADTVTPFKSKLQEETLWTNPNPTSSFSATYVTLSQDINNFDYIKILARYNNSIEKMCEVIISIPALKECVADQATMPRIGICVRGTISDVRRNAAYRTDTSITFSEAYDNTNTALNNYCIPSTISGLKY